MVHPLKGKAIGLFRFPNLTVRRLVAETLLEFLRYFVGDAGTARRGDGVTSLPRLAAGSAAKA